MWLCVNEEEDLSKCVWLLNSLKELQGHCSDCLMVTDSDLRLRAKSLLWKKKKERKTVSVKTESDV